MAAAARAHGVDEAQGATVEGRKTPAENGAAVGVGGAAQHTFFKTACGFIGLREQQPVNQFAFQVRFLGVHRARLPRKALAQELMHTNLLVMWQRAQLIDQSLNIHLLWL